jgi:hypothetical protein
MHAFGVFKNIAVITLITATTIASNVRHEHLKNQQGPVIYGHFAAKPTSLAVESLVLPPDLRQILIRRENSLVAVPLAQVAQQVSNTTVIEIVTRGDQVRSEKLLSKVRSSYGGIYPYVVVKSSDYSYLIVSQENDVLVVGLKNPERTVVTPPPQLVLVPKPDGSLVAQPTAAPTLQVLKFVGRIDPATELPPGVPQNILKKFDFTGPGSTKEPFFEPNRRLAFEITNQHKVLASDGEPYRVFQYNVR